MSTCTVATFDPANIPGLGKPLGEDDMYISRLAYNSLTSIEDQVQLHDKHGDKIAAVLNIISRHSIRHLFRVHSAHGHEPLPDGTVCLETGMGVNGFTWNRACDIKNLDNTKMHARFFKVSEMGFVPFEFAEGPSPVVGSDITIEFLSEVATYLISNYLTDLVELEVGNFAISQAKTAELDVQWGNAEGFTVAVPALPCQMI